MLNDIILIDPLFLHHFPNKYANRARARPDVLVTSLEGGRRFRSNWGRVR